MKHGRIVSFCTTLSCLAALLAATTEASASASEIPNELKATEQIVQPDQPTEVVWTDIQQLDLLTAGRIGLKANPSIQAALLRITEAKAQLEQAQALRWPVIDAQAAYTRSDMSESAFQSAQATARLFDPSATVDNPQDYYKTGITATWILFNGFERQYSIESAQVGQQLSRASCQDSQRRLLAAIVSNYFAAQLAHESIAIAESDEAFNQRLLLEAKARTQAGTGSLSDELNFKVRANSARMERIKAENSYITLMNGLAALLGAPNAVFPKEMALAHLETGTSLKTPGSTAEQLIAEALKKRADVQQVTLTIKQADLQINIARAKFYPTVSLFGSLNGERSDDVHLEQDDFGNAVGFNISYNIFAGGFYNAKLADAHAKKLGAIQTLKNLKLKVASEIRSAKSNLITAHEQLRIQRLNTNLVAQNRELVEKGYLAGEVALVRLNEAQRDLVTAQSHLVLALVSVCQAAYDLDMATGDIIAKFY